MLNSGKGMPPNTENEFAVTSSTYIVCYDRKNVTDMTLLICQKSDNFWDLFTMNMTDKESGQNKQLLTAIM